MVEPGHPLQGCQFQCLLCFPRRTRWSKKHFLVSRVIQPELPTNPVESVEIEAVFSKATQVIAWRELQDESVWRQGWV
jgi:tryptophan-rich hypothetical protein